MEDFIRLYEGVIPEDVCKGIIDKMESRIGLGLGMTRQNPIQQNTQTNIKVQDVSDDFTHYNDFVKGVSKVLFDCLNEYLTEFSILTEMNNNGFVNYAFKIQKTEPGQGYHVWHCEDDIKSPGRRLVWTIYLNDGFEGGETEFLYQHKRVKPTTGSVCIFPTGFTHTHRGNQPLDKIKYIITGWFETI